MIIDLARFLTEERATWSELESFLDKLEKDAGYTMTLDQVKRFHYLYRRTASDLAKVTTFASEPDVQRYVESLVSRAYGEIHEVRGRPHRLAPVSWFFYTFPQTFRRHIRAFWISVAATLVGALIGGFLIAVDVNAKETLMPFSHLQGDPSDRVAAEESAPRHPSNRQVTFAAHLMVHNTKVSLLAFGLGMSWGVGTLVLLFYNGCILGAVGIDYMLAGETMFLCGWLLPHGVIEIPAILLAGQAGLVLASALIGWSRPESLKTRLRSVTGDLVTLVAGIALMLTWAGLVEAIFSQYHEPVVPYEAKILFGVVEFTLLVLLLGRCGRTQQQLEEA